MNETNTLAAKEPSGISRRRFFGYAGAIAGATLLTGMASCSKESYGPDGGVNLGSGDTGILNYAYALEQLEAAFYAQVALTPYAGITAREQSYLNDIRDHEISHRELFRTLLGSSAIPALTTDFSSINFSDRASVLTMARTFEDLGVSAYNGAGKLLVSAANLGLAGKIVSVEARHAAIIRELIQANSFADTTILDAASRRDVAREPADVLAAAGVFITNRLNASNLPSAS